MTNIIEPDYTLAIIERDGHYIVTEGGEERSKAFADKAEAEWWMNEHAKWYQPRCIVCGSAVTRPDDEWTWYSASNSTGADWMHTSCGKRLDEMEAKAATTA